MINTTAPTPQLLSKNSILVTFLIRLLVLYLLWEISFYFIWRSPDLMLIYRNVALLVINGILICSDFIMQILQYETEIDYTKRILRIVGTSGITVGEPCIGYGVMAIFVALIISYPGHIRQKLWFIPIGFSIIYFANFIRITALLITTEINPAVWEFNHKFIFKIVVYTIVLILWDRWMKIAKKKDKEIASNKQESDISPT
jgi:exosortase/archaeosortase family protein